MKSIFSTLAFMTCCFGTVHSQAPGTFDNTFGANGIVLTNVLIAPGSPNGNSDDEARAMAIQSDGKIVVAGVVDDWTSTGYDFSICRYNTDGTLDNTFSGDGKEKTIVSNNIEFVSDVAIQSDGKIIVLGYSNSQFVLVRYNSNGALDNTFGTAGIVLTQVSTSSEQANTMKIQSDGKIVAGGYGIFNGNSDFALVRYNTNGTLDNTFGTAGIVNTAIGNAGESINAIMIQPDGKILATGVMANTGSNACFALVRYNSNGTLDASFGTAGTATVSPTKSTNIANSISLQTDGKIVVGGSSMNTSSFDFSVARFNANGTLDNTFGTNGTIVHSIGVADGINALAIQSSGKIVAAGSAMISNNRNFTLARYTAAGVLDNTFGVNGVVTTSLGPSMAGISDAALQVDGKLVGVGTINNGVNSIDFTVVRYNMECTGPAAAGAIAGSTTVCPGSRTYSVAPVTGATSYSWSLPVGWIGSSTSNSITANAVTSGTLKVAAVNSCNTSSNASLYVKVDICTGINDVSEYDNEILLFPNPSKGTVFIDTKLSDEFNYSITNLLSAELENGVFAEKIELDLTHLPKGHYIISVKSNNASYSVKKRIVLIE